MLKIKDEGIVLEKTNLEFENKAVYNPACIQVGDITHMFYRATGQNDISSIGYCQLKDNKVVLRFNKPIIFPEYNYEIKGVEDPRIIKLEGSYYLFYSAYDGHEALVAYAKSSDLNNFQKMGVITPKFTWDEAEDLFRGAHVREEYRHYEALYKDIHGKNVLLWEKDACLFPKKINGKFAFLHRIMPGIQIVYFDDFSQLTDDFWRDYLRRLGEYIVLDPRYPFESNKIGLGCPPLETSEGWLLITQGVEDTQEGLVYHAGAALLDLNNPLKILGRLQEPLFSPKEEWEKIGCVKNVVFPSGTVTKQDRIYIYYGAADTRIGAKSMLLSDLLNSLTKNP
ncbi:hypothetical protein A3A76_02800 [Candidatus Woesebacteria bacterium RIFCSPLOWO2_01_FULL_39_23]|uniref:Pesticidal protein Cry7Aa n=1 Tax=Candidatus Woesebacteria bacterium RIFCSPHIGHO2_01_FULL_40_22 TaxID=1802499 RepID=A0A1F7YLZ5_9BACT|nr:MAG: hypothetical protein A2141_01220 [Candidatus Woesebacteria bacterium RBG_16_40_11]OGM27618.1 MAG: hypothetical protein A2628_01205 [Candidatus Woesebacteria bacterium RIFCSPHIGHO2_01_FULL_40_22]OGM36194.1 MAG: hypothetical protein A3E41_01490 [Candidatus Woesebacteria bacterium RIFCSPHIGHO2_12_FULL_38_9]OGM62792.1 MAG: hypothetical protein A3A76_02800 [Candidatus Woesebacteria bacterium RIFCSPLOWO2_01_FULL_39_23]